VLSGLLHRMLVFTAIVAMISSVWVAAWAKQEASLAQQAWWPALPHADHTNMVTTQSPILAQANR